MTASTWFQADGSSIKLRPGYAGYGVSLRSIAGVKTPEQGARETGDSLLHFLEAGGLARFLRAVPIEFRDRISSREDWGEWLPWREGSAGRQQSSSAAPNNGRLDETALRPGCPPS